MENVSYQEEGIDKWLNVCHDQKRGKVKGVN